MGGIKVKCSGCDKEFDSMKIKINRFRRADGLTELFFLCQKCKKRYVVCVHSDETLDLQRKITVLDKRGDTDEARKLRILLKKKLDDINHKNE